MFYNSDFNNNDNRCVGFPLGPLHTDRLQSFPGDQQRYKFSIFSIYSQLELCLE